MRLIPSADKEGNPQMDTTHVKPLQESRGKTDQSLSEERSKSDQYLADSLRKVEEQTSETVDLNREATDQAREQQREEVDAQTGRQGPVSPVVEQLLMHEREMADEIQAHEREEEDRARVEERVQKHLITDARLALERESTDSNLLEERDHADLELITRDQFVSIVSHDLKNPAVAIAISAREMRRNLSNGSVDPGDLSEHLRLTEQSAGHIIRMINDLLDVERIAQGNLAMAPQKTEVGALLRECRELYAPIIDSKSFSVTIDVGEEPIFAHIDHDRILEALSNLVGNSLKFTDQGGIMTISAKKQGTEVEISVSDNGPGIPKPLQPHIFERFSQLKMAGRDGLGLGLFIAKWIVEAHHGRIWVTSEPGKGSTFTFTVPTCAS